MALETFSVELEALLTEFLNSLKEAQRNLNGLGKFANNVAKDIDASFADVKIDLKPEGIEETSSAIDKVAESASSARSIFQKINDNFGTIRSSVITLGKTLEVLGERFDSPALVKFGNILFVVGKQIDNSSDAFNKLIKAFRTGDIEGISDSFGEFAFVIRNIGQLLTNLGRRLSRLATLGKVVSGVFGIFSTRARVIGQLAPVLGAVGKALTDVGNRAKRTSGFLAEVGEELPANEAVRSTSILARLGRVLVTLLKVTAVVGAFRGLRLILADIAKGGARTGVALTTLSRAAGLGVSSVAALGASVVGVNTPLGKFLSNADRASFAIGRLSGAATTLAKTQTARNFARPTAAAMLAVENATIRAAKALPGVQLGLNLAGKATNTFRTSVIPAVKQVRALGDNVIGLTTGTLSFIPGVNRATKGVKKLAIATGVAATSLGGASGAASFFATASGKVLAAVAGLNAALIILGVTLDAIGKKLLRTLTNFAERADAANLAFTRLQKTIEATEAATGIAIGGIEEFREQAQILSAVTGQNITDIAKLQSVFVGLQQTLKLPAETLKELIEDTAKAGVAIGDLGGSVIAVKDAFIGILRPLLLRFGATIKQEEVDRLAAEAAAKHAAELEGLSDEAKKAATNLAVAELVLRAIGPAASVAERSELSLRIETGKLAAAQDLLARTIGEKSVPSMAFLTRILRLGVQALQPFIEATAFLIAPLTTLTGVVLRLGGTLLKFGTIFAILSNGFAITNRLLKINIGSFGGLGAIIRRTTRDITGQAIAVRGLGDLFRVLGAFITTGLRGAGRSIGNFVTALTAGGIRATAFRLTIGPLVKLLKNFFGVLITGVSVLTKVIVANIRLIAVSTGWLAIIGVLVAAIVRLNEKYDILGKITEIIRKLFRALFGEGDALKIIMETLGDVVELVLVVALGLLERALLLVVVAIEAVSLGFLGLIKLFNFATFGTFEFGKQLEKVTEEINKTAAAARKRLGEGIKESDKALVDAAKSVVTFGEDVEDAGKKLEEFQKTEEATEARLKQLRVFAELAATGIDASIGRIVDRTDKKLDELTRNFDRRSAELAAATTTSAAEAIGNLETTLINDIASIERNALTEIRGFVEERKQIQLSALRDLRNQFKIDEAERVQGVIDINNKAIATEIEFTEKFKEQLKERIDEIRSRQVERIQAVTQADKAIRDSRRQLNNELFEAELKTLNDTEKLLRLRQRRQQTDADFARAIREKDVEEARRLNEQRATLDRRIGEAGVDNATVLAEANKLSASSTLEENQATFKRLQSLIGNFTSIGITGFKNLGEVLRGAVRTDDLQRDIAAVQAAIQQFAAGRQFQIIQRATDVRKKGLDEINELVKRNAKEAEEADKARLQAAQQTLDDLTRRVDELNEKLTDPKKVLVDADLTAFERAIAEIQARKIRVEAIVEVKNANLEGGSIHPLTDVPRVLGDILGPVAIEGMVEVGDQMRNVASMAGQAARRLGSAVPFLSRSFDEIAAPARQQFAARAAGSPVAQIDPFRSRTPAGPTGPAEIVRVDLNVGGETTPVNVQNRGEADKLVGAIQRTNRTRGNFRTPFTKNG